MVRESGLTSDGAVETSHPVAVVTGASSGIGAAVAAILVAAGWNVHGLARRFPDEGDAAAPDRDRPAPMLARHRLDLSDVAAVRQWTDTFTSSSSRIDALVHVAGATRLSPVAGIRPVDLDGLLAVNLVGPWQLTAGLLPALRVAAGQVVLINSSAALRPGTDNTAYAATKAALKVFADGLRLEEGRHDIRVCSIFPGRVATAQQEQVLAHEGRRVDADRLLRPEDVARTVAYVLALPPRAEITDIHIRPSRPLPS